MIFKIFFVVSLAALCAGVAISVDLWKNKKRKEPKSPFYCFAAAAFSSAAALFVPIYYDIFSSDKIRILKTLLLSVHNTIRLFIVDGEFDIITENVPRDLPIYEAYTVLAAVLFVAAPLLTFGIVASFFKNVFAYQKLIVNRNSQMYVFSELNEKSLILAKDLCKSNKKRIIVFTDVFERNEEENYELVESAKKLGAVCFKEDISKINFGFHSGKKELVFLIIGNDDSENITQSISVINSYKGKDNIRLYIFSQSEQSKLVISGAECGKIKVRRINEEKALIFRTLFDNGGRIFDSALCMEGEQDKIISAMVLGTGAYGTEMVKNLSWFCQMSGYKLFVNAFDKAPNSESRFKSLCPELLSEKRNGDFLTPGEAHYRIDFYSETDVFTDEFDEIVCTLPCATYILVSLGNDELNIKAALKLRTMFAKRNFYPVIDAVVYNSSFVKGVDKLVNFKNQDLMINFIGSSEETYSEKVVFNSDVEAAALKRHLKWGREEDFWKFEYNYSSSVASAIHRKMKEYCRIPGIEKTACERTEQELNAIRVLEHMRWNAYMRADGYTYSPSRNDLAKQHNCLVEFDKLSEADKCKDDD